MDKSYFEKANSTVSTSDGYIMFHAWRLAEFWPHVMACMCIGVIDHVSNTSQSKFSSLQWCGGNQLKPAVEQHWQCSIAHVFIPLLRAVCMCSCLVCFSRAAGEDFFFFSTTKFWFVNHDRTCVMLYVEESDHGWLVKLESFCVIVEFYVSLRVFQLVWVLPLKWLVCDDCNNGFDFMTLFIMNQNEVVQTVKLVKG